jgi:hypothetical protein
MEISKRSDGETLFDLTSFVEDTPASRSQQQENEMALMTHDTYGLGYDKPLANYNLDTQSWRMYEATLLSDSPPFSGSLPASGMTLNGKLFPQTLLVRHISESESLLSPTPSGNWPTPTTADVYTDNLKSSQQTDGSMHSVSLGQAVQMWPTPRSNTAMASLITPEIANDPKRFPNLETVVGRRQEVTGRLNPMWVEWLMGFPLGWTDLEDLETP